MIRTTDICDIPLSSYFVSDNNDPSQYAISNNLDISTIDTTRAMPEGKNQKINQTICLVFIGCSYLDFRI